MPDMEKVIKALERCIKDSEHIDDNPCYKCPYSCQCQEGYTSALKEDALALLKEKKEYGSFIVIDSKTGKEADIYNIALHEDWAKHLCYCDMDGWAIQDDGSLLLLDECGRYAYADRERFKVKWDG